LILVLSQFSPAFLAVIFVLYFYYLLDLCFVLSSLSVLLLYYFSFLSNPFLMYLNTLLFIVLLFICVFFCFPVCFVGLSIPLPGRLPRTIQ
jgi:hypothetical protein